MSLFTFYILIRPDSPSYSSMFVCLCVLLMMMMTTMALSFPSFMQIMWRSWCVRWPAWTCMFSYTRSCVVVTFRPSSPARGSDRTSPPFPPSLPLPGCPSILGPPWEDASPNPNQVTADVFIYCAALLHHPDLVLMKTHKSFPNRNTQALHCNTTGWDVIYLSDRCRNKMIMI